MKYTVIYDQNHNVPIQRSDFECDSDLHAKVIAMTTYDDHPGLYTLYKEFKQIDQFRIEQPSKALTDEQEEELIEQMKSILRSHGIRMMIESCGCCSSPYLRFEYQGQLIIDRIEGHNIDMFESESDE
jgi:hypothetical protein